MQEMNALALDLVDELVVAVESSFGGAPVVVAAPVADQLLQITQWWPLLPGRRRGLVGPAGATQTIAQVAQVGFRYVDTKRLHRPGSTFRWRCRRSERPDRAWRRRPGRKRPAG